MSNPLSDLELVAQAMANAEPRSSSNNTITVTTPSANANVGQPSVDSVSLTSAETAQQIGTTSIPDPSTQSLAQIPGLEDLDLSSLSPSELASLQPILAALSLSGSGLASGDGEEEEEGEFDEGRIEEIMRQFEIADNVADDLEIKLDKLLEKLGDVEEEIEQEQEQDQGADEELTGPRISGGEQRGQPTGEED